MDTAPEVEVKRLIEENGDPTEEYVKIITQIFTRFDRDEDGILNLREFNGMLHASGEEVTDKHTYGGLLMMFEDVDDDKVGRRPTGVSLKGFIQMSVLSTVEDPEGERAQLKKLGFDLPRAAFPDPPTPAEDDDEDIEDDDGSRGEDDDQMLEVIKKIAARVKEEEEKRKQDKKDQQKSNAATDKKGGEE